MENQAIVDQFATELKSIGLTPEFDEDNMIISYTYEKQLQQAFNRIRDRYVRFWKSFGIKVEHDSLAGLSRYVIPLHLIDQQDFTDDQVDRILDGVSKRLGPIG